MTTITLKNVPNDLYTRLKEEAARNRRSLNQEVITRLIASSASPETTEAKLERMRQFRATLPASVGEVSHEDIARWKREGRM